MLAAVNAANYISQASSMFIKVMTNYRQPNIDDGRASSEANRFWTQVAQYPGFQRLIQEANNEDLNINDMENIKELGIKYAHAGISAFQQWQKGPSYSPYVQYVSQHVKDFDISRLVNDATRTMNQYWPFVRMPVSQAMRDPQMQQIAQTMIQLAPKVVKDTGLEPYLRNVRPPPGLGFPGSANYEYGGDDGNWQDSLQGGWQGEGEHYHNL